MALYLLWFRFVVDVRRSHKGNVIHDSVLLFLNENSMWFSLYWLSVTHVDHNFWERMLCSIWETVRLRIRQKAQSEHAKPLRVKFGYMASVIKENELPILKYRWVIFWTWFSFHLMLSTPCHIFITSHVWITIRRNQRQENVLRLLYLSTKQ